MDMVMASHEVTDWGITWCHHLRPSSREEHIIQFSPFIASDEQNWRVTLYPGPSQVDNKDNTCMSESWDSKTSTCMSNSCIYREYII